MPYKNPARITINSTTKERLRKALIGSGMSNKFKSFDDFIGWVAQKIEVGELIFEQEENVQTKTPKTPMDNDITRNSVRQSDIGLHYNNTAHSQEKIGDQPRQRVAYPRPSAPIDELIRRDK